MKYPVWMALVSVLGGHAAAQVARGEVLTCENGGALRHYRSDGTLTQSFSPSVGSGLSGAALLPDGSWATVRHTPSYGLVVFDPVQGIEELDVDIDPGLFGSGGQPVDVESRRDGSILMIDSGDPIGNGGQVLRFDRDGNWLESWWVGGRYYPRGLVVSDDDEVFLGMGNASSGAIRRFAADGSLLLEIPTSFAVVALDLAPDGKLWTVEVDGFVLAYTIDGQIAGGGFYGFFGSGGSLAVADDGTLWFGAWNETELRHYSTTGSLLGTIATGAADHTDLESPHTVRIGANYCPAAANSTGQVSEIVATGSEIVTDADLHLLAQRMPANEFGYFLNSDTQGFVANPGGSAGNLCLGGTIGRHVDSVGNSGLGGALHLKVDLDALPRGTGTHAVMAGETWYFQCWFRDGITSNFSDGVGVTFL